MIGWRTELVLKNISETTENAVGNQEQVITKNGNKSFWQIILQFIKRVFHI